MSIALDFSGARPTVAALQAAGVVAVGRYVTGGGSKQIGLAELDYYLSNGIGVFFICEYGANDVASGFSGGVTNATVAQAAVQQLGCWPAPIYMTADEDVPNPLNALPYYQGASSVLTPALTGDYDEGALMIDLAAQGITTYHWLSESTGFPGYQQALDDGLPCLLQVFNGSPVPDTDLDQILKSDFGQYPRINPPPARSQTGMLTPKVSANGQTHFLQNNVNGDVTHWWQSGASAWLDEPLNKFSDAKAVPEGFFKGSNILFDNETTVFGTKQLVVQCEGSDTFPYVNGQNPGQPWGGWIRQDGGGHP